MADNSKEGGTSQGKAIPQQSFRIQIQPRKPSLTERLVGQSRSWIQTFYTSQENEDQLYGQGFIDPIDDLAPTSMFYNAEVRRRRNSSISSDTSEDSVAEQIQQNNTVGTGRMRTSSISERVAGMQVITSEHEPNLPPARKRLTSSSIGDIDDFSILF